MRTLRFQGQRTLRVADVGVAGLWRLLRGSDELRAMRVVIVAAGMDAALPSVVGGLVPGVVIAVPTSVGYGVAAGGHAALNAVLASCAPGSGRCEHRQRLRRRLRGAAHPGRRQQWNDAPS